MHGWENIKPSTLPVIIMYREHSWQQASLVCLLRKTSGDIRSWRLKHVQPNLPQNARISSRLRFEVSVPMEKGFRERKALKAVNSEFVTGYGDEKISQPFRFHACFLSPLILVLIMTLLVYFEWNTLSSVTISENIAFASEYQFKTEIAIICQPFLEIVTTFRSLGYAFLMKKLYQNYKQQAKILLVNR